MPFDVNRVFYTLSSKSVKSTGVELVQDLLNLLINLCWIFLIFCAFTFCSRILFFSNKNLKEDSFFFDRSLLILLKLAYLKGRNLIDYYYILRFDFIFLFACRSINLFLKIAYPVVLKFLFVLAFFKSYFYNSSLARNR